LTSQFPGPTRKAFEQLEADPMMRSERQHQLRGSASTTTVAGRPVEQWQYELTGGARILYAIDPANRTVWVLEASPGHPKHTERVRGVGSQQQGPMDDGWASARCRGAGSSQPTNPAIRPGTATFTV